MKGLAVALCVTCMLTSVSSTSRINQRADDGEPLEAVVMKLSSDLSKMSAELSLLKTELADVNTKLGECSFKRMCNMKCVQTRKKNARYLKYP